MKIAVWHNLKSGGGKRALFDHVKGLVARGHTVVSHCPDTADPDYLPLSNLIVEKIYPLKEKVDKNTSSFKFLNTPQLINERLKAELTHCRECAADINAGGFDLLLANSSFFFSMSHIGRFVNIPSILYLGEPHRQLYESGPYYAWRAPKRAGVATIKYAVSRLKQLYKMYWWSILVREEFLAAQYFDKILVNSFFSRESLKRAYQIDSEVCYLGIDVNCFPYQDVIKEPFVVGMGAVIANKGIELCIQSVSHVDDSIRPTLIWIGNRVNSQYSQSLINYAVKLNVKLEFKTNVSDAELKEYLAKASAFLYFPHLEPFGLAPLEANACGTAVISIKEGGIRETIIDDVNGYTVNRFDAKQVAVYITKLIENPEFAYALGRLSQSHIVNEWNLDKGIDNLERSMYDLLQLKAKTNGPG